MIIRYPPLPDIILDKVPHIPWAFEMTELTGMTLLLIWFIMIICHKHRLVGIPEPLSTRVVGGNIEVVIY